MKKSVSSLFLLAILGSLSIVQAQTAHLTAQEALNNVKQHFSERVVDYYLTQSDNADSLIIFVDAEPTMNWGHECYTFTFPKQRVTDKDLRLTPKIREYNFPPKFANGLQPLEVKVNVPLSHVQGPIVHENPQPLNGMRSMGLGQSSAYRTHAIIISGGIDEGWNYYRYWNDCSFIYQTLTKRYYIPKDHIHPFIADGGIQYGSLIVQTEDGSEPVPNDLDRDGMTDILYEAKYHMIKNAFHNFEISLQPLDHVFVYVIDHGGLDETCNQSYICLWGENEKLYASQLREMIKPLTDKNIFVNIVMGQCYSGGFIEKLYDLEGLTIATACRKDEKSGVFFDETQPLGNCLFKYDEFVYHWTSAINGATAYGEIVNADYNGNGYISLEEAFIYAAENDRLSTETPLYYSNPTIFGKYSSFNRLPHTNNYDELYNHNNEELFSFLVQSNELRITKNQPYSRTFNVVTYMLPMSFIYESYLFEGADSELVIDLSDYPGGIYVVTMNDGFSNITFKIDVKNPPL